MSLRLPYARDSCLSGWCACEEFGWAVATAHNVIGFHDPSAFVDLTPKVPLVERCAENGLSGGLEIRKSERRADEVERDRRPIHFAPEKRFCFVQDRCMVES